MYIGRPLGDHKMRECDMMIADIKGERPETCSSLILRPTDCTVAIGFANMKDIPFLENKIGSQCQDSYGKK